MEKVMMENNQVTIFGKIGSEFRYSHKVYGEEFYLMDIRCRRLSGTYDRIPVMVSDRLMDVSGSRCGDLIQVRGQFRSHNGQINGENKLHLSVFALEVSPWDGAMEGIKENQISLDGYICKKPIYRKTPLGRELADLILAVNRMYGKSDYIPCIAWERNASFASRLQTGSRIKAYGRIQSREYRKMLEDGSIEAKMAFEVSINTLELVEKTQ